MGFHIDQVLTSVAGESGEDNVFVPQAVDRGEDLALPASSGFTVPWWALLSTRNLDAPPSEEPELVFVQFGFPLTRGCPAGC